jgi:hypothetical protein
MVHGRHATLIHTFLRCVPVDYNQCYWFSSLLLSAGTDRLSLCDALHVLVTSLPVLLVLIPNTFCRYRQAVIPNLSGLYRG